MAQIIKRVEAHYESREMPFGKVYEWHPAYVVLECGCGEKVTLTATSTTITCGRCGAELGSFVYDIRERAQQHKRDEVAYSKGTPWRYNDITAATNEE